MIQAAVLAVLSLGWATAQDRRANLDVDNYKIQVRIDPAEHSLDATAQVTFLPLDERTQTVTFELNNALSLLSVADASGQTLQSTRNVADSTIRVSFPQPLTKGQSVTIVFRYGGRLSGEEDSPVAGVQFASIRPDHSFLLYPSRWFPVSGYTSDRYQMELSVEAPADYRVVTSGTELASPTGGKVFRSTSPGFHGSLALMKGTPRRISAEGVSTDMWFLGEHQAAAPAFGEATARVMTFLTSLYGLPPQRNLTLVETADGAPNGYSAPGMLFLAPVAIQTPPSERLLANQISRQWLGGLVAPVNRNHIWIVNGLARYSELLYMEQAKGESIDLDLRDLYVDALTVTDAPVRQAARYEDYSPEYFAVTGAKGAATYHMLRWLMGDEAFKKLLKALPEQFATKPASTDDVRKLAENLSGQALQGFFIQWLESTGAPEFRLEYTIYRTRKGFRVMGKIQQDLDTFRMPVELRIDTEGTPEFKRVDVVGPATDFSVETFGKPKKVTVDPAGRMLRLSPEMRVAVAVRKGEQFTEIGEYNSALSELQKALEVKRSSSLAHYRVAEVFFLQGNYQSAANEFREALNGDLDPKWIEVWSHLKLGNIFDITQQRERAVNEYTLAVRTKDNTQGAQEEAARFIKAAYQRKEKN
jgi:tetratricopeptide (TPR) repeat protein